MKQAMLKAMLQQPGWFTIADIAMITHGNAMRITQATLRPKMSEIKEIVSEYYTINKRYVKSTKIRIGTPPTIAKYHISECK